MISETSSLEEVMVHFGVKGMRWGVINKDETGSKSSRKEIKREAKVQKFQLAANVANVRVSSIQKELNQLPPGFRTLYKRYELKTDLDAYTARRDSLLKDADAVRNGKLTSTQKQLIIGGIAVAAIAGIYMYGKMSESGQGNSLKLRGEAFVKGKPFEFAKNPELARKDLSPNQVLNQVAKQVNPNYSKAGGKMNCRRSTFAYELRRRGYDVSATTSSLGYGQSESGMINALTPGTRGRYGAPSMSQMILSGKGPRAQILGDARSNPAKTALSVKPYLRKTLDATTQTKLDKAGIGLASRIRSTPVMSTQNAMSTLFKQPDGSRGEILFNFKEFGHSMAYEMFDGKPMIFDSQKGVMYDASKGLGKLTAKWGTPIGAEITRLDNMDLDMKFLSRWATNK